MKSLTTLLAGRKTYIAGAGLLALAFYQVTVGDLDQAAQSLFTAGAAFGIRSAVAKSK